ncbi:trypsin-like peptidase domain-containing protein [Caldovatus sp. SYSU G05006]|uniref:Trypsin-like peptidase domain-containing protein n=2 Tax=Caldovatus aquaticus TaxID=2865671 RepID=A0ABS7F609_9PROT|nr:trypsin-like peptidase domain-containing protein [Caldovatus aquaticus]
MNDQSRFLARLLAIAAAGLLLVLAWNLYPLIQAELLAPRAVPRAVTPRGDLAEDERSTIALFEAARDSVVYIATTERVLNPWTRNALDVPRGTGSGFLWDRLGHVVTNHHVVAGASGAIVRLADGRAFRAALVGTSPAHDLAVLRIGVGLGGPEPLPIGTSGDLKVGQKVFAIGNPFGLDWTLTTGIVSALNRELPNEAGGVIEGLIQTDAAINPGNSGGPLLDSAGRLIGVNTAIYSPSGAYAGIGFAVPVDTVNRVVPRLIATGRYVRPSLGVRAEEQVNAALSARLGIEGVFVLAVEPGSPAERAGIRPAQFTRDGAFRVGDVIVALGGRPVRRVADLLNALDRSEPGQTVPVTLLRNGERIEVAVTLGVAP